MGKKNKAKQKAKALLQEVGANLGVKEAARIARKADIPVAQVARIAERQDINVRPAVTAPPPSNDPPPPPPPPPGPTNELTQYAGPGGGFGINSWQRALDAGYDATQIASLLPGSGLPVGEKAQAALSTSLADLKQSASNANTYKSELETIGSRYESRFSELNNQYEQALSGKLNAESQLSSAKSEAESAKLRADELEKQSKEERELQVSQQLGSLRGGSTVYGSPGAGLGSLASGRSSYSISTGGKSGGVLDRAYKDIDPTDSVLNKDVASDLAKSTGGASRRSEARQRALAGGGASSYYARRFG